MSHGHAHSPADDTGEIVAPGAKEAHAHHGHVIVPKRTLVAVLVILMTFTALTVFAAHAEAFIAHAFDAELPQWMNVAVALSIAVIKSIIVAAYFMQLRYDNPMNTAIVVFTFMVLACFLGFTMIDLGARDALEPIKARYIVEGGTGDIKRPEPSVKELGKKEIVNVSGPIAVYSLKRAQELIDQLTKAGVPRDQWPKRVRRWAEHIEHGDAHGPNDHASSSANRSRPKTGITLPELIGSGHGDQPHSGTPAEEHAPAAKPAH